MRIVRKIFFTTVALAALSMIPDREAEAVNVVVGCFSGSFAGVALIPTVWCSAVWSPGGPSTLILRFNATAVRLADGATASGSRQTVPFPSVGTLGPIIANCSSIASAATMNGTATRYIFLGRAGLVLSGPPVLNNVLGGVGISPSFQGCLPIL